MARWGGLLILLLSLTACVSAVSPTETPFVIQRIGVAQELEGLVSPWLHEYITITHHANIKLEPLPSHEIFAALESGRVDLGLISEEVPEGWFVTPVWREAIAVIVNPEITLETLDMVMLADVFSGRMKTWHNLTGSSDAIQAVIPPPGSIVREKFSQNVMGNAAFDPAAMIGSIPEEVYQLVKTKPGAIGFLPNWRVENGVDIVAISGITPEADAVQSGAYPLWLDMVAVSPEEPIGNLRDFLVWLQGNYLPSELNQ
jgi:ABC-type phosphate transport system substrate-binding protein